MAEKQAGTVFVVLCAQIIGGTGEPFKTAYHTDSKLFDDRKAAIRHGLRIRGSDDFNIGVLTRGKLTSLDWMEEPVDTDPDLMAEIQEETAL